MIARWGYSRSLAIWNIVGEVHISDGWVSDRQGVAAWASKAHEYFKKYDPWQHLTTGTSSGQFTQWWSEGFEVFDLAAREIYESHGYPFNHTGQIDKDETHPLTYSYRNYHREIKKLWDNFEKPAVTGESGWDHTFYEPDMPGYLALYHNALWASLASGSAMSPFWWSYSNKLNDNVVTNQMLYFKRFADQVPFSKLTNISPLEIKNSEGDAYVMGSDQLIFGWAANADTDMSGKTITISDIGRGKYSLKLYHTWSGRFLENEDGSKEQIVESKGKLILFDIPVLKTKGHAQYVGKDIAFILKPLE